MEKRDSRLKTLDTSSKDRVMRKSRILILMGNALEWNLRLRGILRLPVPPRGPHSTSPSVNRHTLYTLQCIPTLQSVIVKELICIILSIHECPRFRLSGIAVSTSWLWSAFMTPRVSTSIRTTFSPPLSVAAYHVHHTSTVASSNSVFAAASHQCELLWCG